MSYMQCLSQSYSDRFQSIPVCSFMNCDAFDYFSALSRFLVPKYSQKQHLKFSWRGLRDWYTQRQWQWSPTNPVIQNPCFSKTPIKWAGALSLVFAYPYYLKSRNGVGEVRNRNKLSSFWHSKKKTARQISCLHRKTHSYTLKIIVVERKIVFARSGSKGSHAVSITGL